MINNSKKLSDLDEASAMFGKRLTGNKVNSISMDAVTSSEAIVDDVRFFANKLATVNVFLPNGTYLTNLLWPGGYIDPETQELHGDYVPPVRGQSVLVDFPEGDSLNARIVGYIFKSSISDEAELYVRYKTKNDLPADAIVRSHRSGVKQVFTDKKVVTGLEDGGRQEITDESIKSGIAEDGEIDEDAQILQESSGIKLGKGGPSGYKEVAVVGDNYVLTLLGLQPILLSTTRVGPFAQKVKA